MQNNTFNVDSSTEKETFVVFEPDRLRKLRKQLRFTQLELATMLGIHRTYLVLIEKGKKIPSQRLQRTIDEFTYKVDTERNQRVPFVFETPANARGVVKFDAGARQVPVVSWARAGSARDYEDLCGQIDERVETNCKDENSFGIILEGDSMEAKFFAGDRVVFAPNLEPRNGDAVVAKLVDGRVMFKWFYRTGPEGLRVKLVSENSSYAPIELDRSELLFVYPAWEVKRLLRRG